MGAPHKRAGRIELQEDATGAQEFFYGALGEVVKNVRTVVIPHFDASLIVEQIIFLTVTNLLHFFKPHIFDSP
jgi:hypothetical protein